MPPKKYRSKLIARLSIFTLLIVLVSALLIFFFFKQYFNGIYLILLFFNILVTYFVLAFLFDAYTGSPKKFNSAYLLFLPIKFLIYLIFFVVYIFVNRANAMPFTIVFMLFYFLYSGFEVREILQFSKIK